jgi:hypothetical protein
VRRPLFIALCAIAPCATLQAHDIITTPITWDREISRIVYSHCASCHHEGGMAFSLMTYKDARPWAEAIKEETLAHTMPPWGGVKGFGDFRNDQALTPEQIEVITSWADGGVPEGEEKDLSKVPDLSDAHAGGPPKGLAVTGEFKLKSALKLDGLWPQTVPDKTSIQITAEFPDGSILPLVWLEDYKPKYAHPFLFREPLDLPAGSMIHGVPPGATIVLLKATSTH